MPVTRRGTRHASARDEHAHAGEDGDQAARQYAPAFALARANANAVEAEVDSELDVVSSTSPLSPISPWPPVPSPPRQSRRRASSAVSGAAAPRGLDRTLSCKRREESAAGAEDDENKYESVAAGMSGSEHAAADEQSGSGSDTDTGTENANANSNADSTLPSAPEVYGSIAVLGTYAGFTLYLVWAFAPAGWLDTWGWTWYPDREWAVIVPCYIMFLVLLTYWTYAGLTAWHTAPFDSLSLITDPYANIPPSQPGAEPYYHKFAAADAIPQAVDLPIDLVNRVLYPPRRRQRVD